MRSAAPSHQPGRRDALRRIALVGLGASCATGFGALWVRAGQDSAFAADHATAGMARIDHQLGWTRGVQFGGNFMAQEQGWFARERLDVRYTAGGPGTDYRSIVAAGHATVSESNPAGMIEAAIQGQPLIAFAAIMQRDPGCIISAADRPVRSLRAMIGRTIGIPANIRGQLEVLMRRERIDPASVRFVPLGADPGMLAAGQIDGFYSWATSAMPPLILSGFRAHMLPMSDIGVPGYGALLIARRDRLQRDFDRFVRYTRALIGGWGWMVAHPRETAQIVVEKYADAGRDLAEQTLQAEMIRDYVAYGDGLSRGLLWLGPEIFEAAIRLARDAGAIPPGKRILASDLMTQDVVKAALGKP